MQEKIRNNVMGIRAEFVQGDHPQQTIDLPGIDNKQCNPADDFEHAVNGLAYQADIEKEVDCLVAVVFCHFHLVWSGPHPARPEYSRIALSVGYYGERKFNEQSARTR